MSIGTRLLAVLAVAVLLSGCASIIQGTTQDISFASKPDGAQVLIDGIPRGVTPLVVSLTKNRSNTVTMNLDGYRSQTFPMTKRYDPIALINVFWDLSTTDLITGAAFEYEQNSYYVDLEQNSN